MLDFSCLLQGIYCVVAWKSGWTKAPKGKLALRVKSTGTIIHGFLPLGANLTRLKLYFSAKRSANVACHDYFI